VDHGYEGARAKDIEEEIARGLGLDAVSVHELSRRGYSDGKQLRYTAEEERIFVTRNRDDFLLLTIEFYRAGEAHPGVLIVGRNLPNDRPKRISHALARWADTHPPESIGAVDFL
jgi:hypothetical protein